MAVVLMFLTLTPQLLGQDQTPPAEKATEQPAPKADQPTEPEPAPELPTEVPQQIDVNPIAQDVEIELRLQRILETTEWFENPVVAVDEGVVFIRGRTASQEYKDWAGKLAGKTQDVVAVVNRIQLIESPLWDLSPAWNEFSQLGKSAVRGIPMVLLTLLLLTVTWYATRFSKWLARKTILRKMQNALLREVYNNVIAVPVLIVGVYLILKVSGLTGLAATVLGGTGLFGLIVGIAFRDIAENFLASILISMQRPFEAGDLIEVNGMQGFVQRVTTRGTLLMTLEGNHIQIPNSMIYKNTTTNFTANPNVRMDFAVGIGFDAPVAKSQDLIARILAEHPAVLQNPEPNVLVEKLSDATVDLRVFFWVDGKQHSGLKVKSSLMRIVKRALQDHGVSMPDAAREVIFPEGIRVFSVEEMSTTADTTPSPRLMPPPKMTPPPLLEDEADKEEEVESAAEGGFNSEAEEIQQQAQQSRVPTTGSDLLQTEPATDVPNDPNESTEPAPQ